YRRLGHNEGDEPSFTQPRMYEAIRTHPTPFQVYKQRLVAEGVVTEDELKAMTTALAEELEAAQDLVENGGSVESGNKPFQDDWADMSHVYDHSPVQTGVTREALATVARVWRDMPEG